MEDARHRLSEVKLRKEELAARRAARQAARLREKKRLEQLRLKGKLKCNFGTVWVPFLDSYRCLNSISGMETCIFYAIPTMN